MFPSTAVEGSRARGRALRATRPAKKRSARDEAAAVAWLRRAAGEGQSRDAMWILAKLYMEQAEEQADRRTVAEASS